jgi:hypothetical protein
MPIADACDKFLYRFKGAPSARQPPVGGMAGSRRSHGSARSVRVEECARAADRGIPGTCHHGGGAACRSPFGGGACRRRRAALVRPEPVRTGQLSATTQPDEHEHQDHEAGRAIAPEAVEMSEPVPVKVRGLPPHPP